MMHSEFTDVAVIGAGPAGLSAATVAAQHGARVVLLDEQDGAGGQIYRGVASASAERLKVLGADYAAGADLLSMLDGQSVSRVQSATIWEVTKDRTIYYSVQGSARLLHAKRIIIATGATERPMPIPGWTLPGVMTAGAGQILLKRSGLLPVQPVVLAGSGPLLYLLAVQLLTAGVKPCAVVDTTPAGNRRKALRHVSGAIAGYRLLIKGLGLLQTIRRSGVPVYRNAQNLIAKGDDRVEVLAFTTGGVQHAVDCNALLLHNGVVPNVQISRSLSLEHRWDAMQLCWRPVLDATGACEIDGIWIAGDGAGIAGAEAAVSTGRLAGLACIKGLETSVAVSDEALIAERRRVEKQTRVRPFLDVLYQSAKWLLFPADGTIVCRCEEVTAAQIRSYVALGCQGPNQVKSYGRCGMGPCQGRYCGLTVSHVIAEARNVPVEEIGYYRLRPPLKPVTLSELASLAEEVEADCVG